MNHREIKEWIDARSARGTDAVVYALVEEVILLRKLLDAGASSSERELHRQLEAGQKPRGMLRRLWS
jgi:hypothetical protein